MHSPGIRVDSLLSAREYTAPIHSTGSHPNTSLLRARWTPARILRPSHIHHGSSMPGQLSPAACSATSMLSTCTLRVERPRRTAVHFFPHTRPPETLSHPLDCGAAVEYQGPLVNTYFSLVLSSMPKAKQRRGYRRSPGAAMMDTARTCTCMHTCTHTFIPWSVWVRSFLRSSSSACALALLFVASCAQSPFSIQYSVIVQPW